VPDNFTGRDKLLADVLHLVGTNDIAVVGVRGLPGVGKTTFALALAERLSPQYPAQIFLDLKGNTKTPLTSVDVMTHVVYAYRGEEMLPTTLPELTGLYYTVLHAQRALLVFDNVKDAAQIQPLMPPKSCFVVLTSRQLFTLPNLHAIDLSPLSPPDARDLLIKIVPRCATEAPRIAALCGFLPIALCAAGSALAEERDVRPDEYAKRLADTRARLQLIDPSTDVSLEASLSLSCSLLRRRLRRRFEALSAFRDTVERGFASYIWRTTRTEAHADLRALSKYSLITYDEASDRYSLHDLVAVYAYARLSKRRRLTLACRHAFFFTTLALLAERHYLRGETGPFRGLRLFHLAWPNLELALERMERYVPLLLALVLDGCRYCLAQSRPPAERLRWLQAVPGRGTKAIQARLLADTASAYRHIGEPQRATEYARRAIALSTKARDKRAIPFAENILLRAAVDLGESQSEIESALAKLNLARDGGRAEDIRQALHYLGKRYFHSMAYRQAIDCFQESLTLARTANVTDEILSALDYIALAYQRLSDFAAVIQWSEEEAELARQEGAFALESAAYGRLALSYERQGDGSRAYTCYGRRLGTLRDADGPILPEDIQIVSQESLAWSTLGYPDRGRTLGKIALELARLLGHRHVESHALFVLALAYDKLGDDDEVKRCLTEAAEIARSVGFSVLDASAKFALSDLAAEEGDIATAISIGEAALAVFEKFPAHGLEGVRAHVTKLRERAAALEQ
jgi:tetratricopeptide (TPR) repeat protein